MTMAIGAPCPTMVQCGCLAGLSPDGRPIGMATGFGFHPGAGLGSMMHRGGLLHSIMVAGLLSAELGVGALGLSL